MPADSADPIIEIRDLRFAFGSFELLSGVNLRVPRGKIVGIMGRSGSGKSTILRLIGGQLRPSGGQVLFDGVDVHAQSRDDLFRLRRRMGMLFQAGGLFTDLSVFENIAFQMREHTDLPESMIEDLVRMKLQSVGLRGAASLMPSELSGGMSRRVGLARAVAVDPSLIIYDEPFAGLDPISVNVIGNLILTLNRSLGGTSVIVSYDAKEVLKVVDYVFFLSEGRIVAEGSVDAVKTSTDPYVKQFIHGEPDGPVPFHLPNASYAEDLGLAPRV